MKQSGACPKCGSTKIIHPARILGEVEVGVDANPRALLKGTRRSDLAARVCSQCSYVELYATDIAALYSAFWKAQKSKRS